MAAFAPDVVVVVPHMNPGVRDSDYLKAARSLGLRTALAVASWDNLSSKQQIHEVPDRVFVWNEIQRDEAARFHRVEPEKVIVTGAQPFDHWFTWPPRPRAEFAERVGLDPARPYLLYVAGSLFPAEVTEAEWARRWIEELRAAPQLQDVGVLLRPHPKRGGDWSAAAFDGLDNVAVWPRQQDQMPIDAERRADFFDSIFHSVGVFGLNTSAMIEAAVVGRPVHTILAPEFADSQQRVVHFDYLRSAGGGILTVAESFDEMRLQLVELVERGVGEEVDDRRRGFLEAFVRPHGIERPAAPIVADAIESVARLPAPVPRKTSILDALLRVALGAYVRARRAAGDARRARRRRAALPES